MKYTIEGFSQAEALKMQRTEIRGDKEVTVRIDATDLLILRWFVDFFPRMKKKTIDGREYVWLKHSELAEDMPILGITTRACIARMKKLVSFGILDYRLIKHEGTWSYYTFGKQYQRLISDGIRSNAYGAYVQTHTPAYVQTNVKDPSTSDPSTIDSSSPETGGRGGGIAYDEWGEAYERLCPSLPKMRVLSEKRKAAVRSMIKQGLGIDDFREACRMAEGSEFLKGGGSTGWKADADWMFNANNVVKVLEGRYDTVRDDRPHGTEPVVEKWKPAPDPIEELRKFEAANPDLVREMERMGY